MKHKGLTSRSGSLSSKPACSNESLTFSTDALKHAGPAFFPYLVILAHNYVLRIKQLLVLRITDIILAVQRLLMRNHNTINSVKYPK